MSNRNIGFKFVGSLNREMTSGMEQTILMSMKKKWND
jgi:hypothetical protein